MGLSHQASALLRALEGKDVVRLLQFVKHAGIDAKVDMEGEDYHLVAHCARYDFTEGLERLILGGAHVGARGKRGFTALHIARSAAAVDMLLTAGSDKEARTVHGLTPLMDASWLGRTEVAAALLDAGAVVDAVDEDDWTALARASDCGHREVVELLLDAGADTAHHCNAGWTALARASYSGHREVVELLLDAGADTAHHCKEWKTAEERAIDKDHKEIAAILRAAAEAAFAGK